jgi:hypothetical protein
MRENMLKEALKEVLDRKSARFELAGIGGAILEGNLGGFHAAARFERKQAAIADGNPMDIGSEIFKGGLPIANGLAVHDPLLRPDLGGDLLKEIGFLQTALEGSAKQPGECPHRQEEPLASRQPGLAIGVQAASGSEVMHMRMKDQVAGPGVKDTHQTDLAADMARVERKFLSGLCRSLKEQGIQSLLIGAHQIT